MSETPNSNSFYVAKESELFLSKQKSNDESNISDAVFNANNDRLAVIEASAGTGKTFALVELVLELLLEQEIPLKSILLVTFTEKATAELRLRLRTKLRDLLEACEQNDDLPTTVPEEPFWEINTVRRKQLKAALIDFDSAPVYTIHGFCKRILREFAFENRQLFEQKLCEIDLLFPEVFRRYVRRKLLSRDTAVAKLFALYVKYAEGDLASLEKDIVFLLSKYGEFKPYLPNFEVFHTKFSACWKVLVYRDLILRKKDVGQHPLRSAFEKTALNETSRRKTMINLDSIIESLSSAHAGASISEILPDFLEMEAGTVTIPRCRKTLKSGEEWLSPKDFQSPELAWIDALANCEKLLQDYDISGGSKKILKAWVTQQIIEDVRRDLSQAKLEQGAFDYDDLLRIVEEQVTPQNGENSISTALTKAVRKKYVCAIVDEFQDTDRRQWNIFRHLFLESPEHRLIVIGDPKQAIYSFRGADIFTYLQARKIFQQKTSRLAFVLKKNFRSSKEMLCGLNQIFSDGRWFPEKRGILYQHVGCGKPELELKDDTPDRNAIHLMKLLPQFTVSGKKIAEQKMSKDQKIPLTILDKLSSLSGKKYYGNDSFLRAAQTELGIEISIEYQSALLNLFLDEQAEVATIRFAEEIALEIKSILRIGSTENRRPLWQDEDGERVLKEQDICVLFRKSNEGKILGKALRRHGIDFSFYKQKGLFEGREALEILDLLDAVAYPFDHSRTAKLWLTRFFCTKINELTEASTFDAELLHQLQEWNSLAVSQRFRKLFDQVLQRTKLIERELLLGGDERSVTNYVHLFELLNRKAIDRHLDLFELIQLLKSFIEGKEDPGENENLLRLESERDAVQLMTMHSAKGLEFPVVFLFGGLTGNQKKSFQFYHDSAEKPIIDMLNSKVPAEYEWQVEGEQQRLLYVAMTRACGRLYLPCVGFLQGNSGKRICKVSSGYSMLNDQLSMISEQIFAGKNNSTFSISLVGEFPVNLAANINATEQELLRNWNPPELPEITESISEIENPQIFFSQLRYKQRGFVLTSFSRMQRKNKEQNSGLNCSNDQELSTIEIRGETELGKRREDDEAGTMHFSEIPDRDSDTESQFTISNVQKDPLPGGSQTGNLLHELLEHVEFATLRESRSKGDWLEFQAVSRMIRSINERYGRLPETDSRIAEIIWNSLRTPLRLGKNQDAPVIELAYVKKYLREADFYFPIPNKTMNADVIKGNGEGIIQGRYSGIGVGGWAIEKGFLRGSIDFLFEHESKIYLLDWKSNLLKNYGQESVENEVMKNYELQLQIYILATSYWFKLDSEEKYNEKFGGVLYIFVRGIGRAIAISGDAEISSNEGVYFKRPSWTELKAYETRLSQEKY